MFTLLLWTGLTCLGYYCVQCLSMPLEDVLDNVTAPLPAATGILVLYRHFEGIIRRITYIGILFYWYIFTTHKGYGPHQMFSTLLMELMRGSKSGRGPTDDLGRHWTHNIAEQFYLLAFGIVTERYWANHYWTMTLVTVFLTLFVFGHHVFQLWMQKQIARLTRWNRHAWTWRDLIIEYTLQSLIHKLDSPLSRGILHKWWSGWYWFYQYMTSKRISQVAQYLFFLRVASNSRILSYGIRWCLVYSIWIKELAKFSNPDPLPYKYEELRKSDHIRVLLLHPTFGFRPISCNLVQGPHMRRLFYEAISYTWGGDELTQQIMIDGCTMKVTESVYEILTSYSSLLVPKLLWIDALCIDQRNMEEKSLQVPLMQKIYSNALFTTVFLGRASTSQRRVFGGISKILPYRYDGIYAPDKATKDHNDSARAVIDLFNEFHVLKEGALRTSAKNIYELYEMLPTKSKPKQWNALLRLLQHPWFSRVWVVQEVALSEKVFVKYGDETIEWDVLAEALAMLHRSRNFRLWLECTHNVQLRHIQNTSMYNVIRIDKLRESLHPKSQYDRVHWPTVPRLLSESFYFRATNPRDQIFGLMALCQEPLDVDYSVSVEDTFIYAAKALLHQGSVGILFHAGGVGNRPEIIPGLPTWVPDWRGAPQYDPLPQSTTPVTSFERKPITKAPVDITLKNDTTLTMNAVHIDAIVEIGPVIFDPSDANGGTLKEMHQLATRWKQSVNLLARSPYISHTVYAHDAPGQDIVEAFYRTMLCGKQSFGWKETLDKYLTKLSEWESRLSQFDTLPTEDMNKGGRRIYELLESMDDITEEVESCCGGRRLFVTRNGYMGLCPPHTRKGDEVHAVKGLHVSVLLRRVHMGPLEVGDAYDPRSQYQLVGEAYCHGAANRGTGHEEAQGRHIEVI